jgi:hypothetical protein
MGIAFRIVWRNLPARFGIAMLLEKHDPPNRFRLFDTNHDQNQTLLLHSKRFDYARRSTNCSFGTPNNTGIQRHKLIKATARAFLRFSCPICTLGSSLSACPSDHDCLSWYCVEGAFRLWSLSTRVFRVPYRGWANPSPSGDKSCFSFPVVDAPFWKGLRSSAANSRTSTETVQIGRMADQSGFQP